jgi:hypothetical protein
MSCRRRPGGGPSGGRRPRPCVPSPAHCEPGSKGGRQSTAGAPGRHRRRYRGRRFRSIRRRSDVRSRLSLRTARSGSAPAPGPPSTLPWTRDHPRTKTCNTWCGRSSLIGDAQLLLKWIPAYEGMTREKEGTTLRHLRTSPGVAPPLRGSACRRRTPGERRRWLLRRSRSGLSCWRPTPRAAHGRAPLRKRHRRRGR